uniref:DUF4220 domain-containing protein n=1 Tax=Oryza punctata TaxID=4537 RepID=A0A0E0KMJ5_ORYPU
MTSTVFLDIRWLLTAVVSTWTYLHHRLPARWCALHRFVLSLDPCRLLVKEEPTRYRMWLGTIGQYNLLHECTYDTTSMFSLLVKKVASDDHWMEYEYQYSRAYPVEYDVAKEKKKEKEPEKKPDPPKKLDPIIDARNRVKSVRELQEALDFLPEFQESILILHIATDVFYLCTESDQNAASSKQLVKAIKTLSDYMVSLAAVCPGMLPGLKLRSLYEATRKYGATKDLPAIAQDRQERSVLPTSCMPWRKRGETVAKNLNNWRRGYRTRNWKPDFISKLYDSSIILSDGIKLAELMLRWLRTGYRDFRIPHTKSEKKN